MTEHAYGRFSMLDAGNQTPADNEYVEGMAKFAAASPGDAIDHLRNFAKFVPRQTLALLLAKNDLFRRIVTVHGHIVECGVFLGGGLMTWAQLSAIYEPYNHIRRIVGFDTFAGFPSLDADRDAPDGLPYSHPGGLATHAESDLLEAARLYDLNRPLGHIPRIEVVVGDAAETIPRYIEDNQHVVVAMLYLDFDLYEPTRAALETFVPRMPRGAIIAFDELAQRAWPGETRAVLDTLGIRTLKIERFEFTPQLSFAVLD